MGVFRTFEAAYKPLAVRRKLDAADHGARRYDTKSPTPVAFRLYDLSDPARVSSRQLDIPLNWSDVSWSADSSYVSFIGGAPGRQTRPLYVVDARAPLTPPRLITECGNGSAFPSPACPALALVQPQP